MNTLRFLTTGEATLLSDAAERWLRLRDVEINLGELALKVLRAATLRPAACRRRDIASLNWTIDAQFPGASAPVAFTLVSPAAADITQGRVSLLSFIGLALIGHAIGAVVRLPLRGGQAVDARLVALRPCPELTHISADKET
ncbi:GreA/GreB family elongation factor [Variovorax sp. PBL-E5]|uniref:GreA/GreB family elongation factor n=1 Tax=Variovorax sp. PBL-E5 TaxID=434014 RepID=UPI001318C04A|nr:GreA/GreB family elongation factor [Variovorax sp. PBL-E5]VTU23172.1 nucleoside diphosphate kinase regulator [Variovorax sp. PBL-E5]